MRHIWLLVLLVPTLSMADVLVDEVPAGADPSRVLAVVRQAFIGRQWTVESADADAVTATIRHNHVHARMKVSLSDGKLVYDSTAFRRRPQSNPATREIAGDIPMPVPESWLRNLRVDIGRMLVVLPAS